MTADASATLRTQTPQRRIAAMLVPKRISLNPYLALLAHSLKEAGVRVRLKNKLDHPFLRPREDGRLRILHLHWIPMYYVRPSLAGTAAATLRFFWQLARLRRSGVRIVWTIHDLHGFGSPHPQWEHACSTLLLRLASGAIVHSSDAAETAGRAFHFPPDRLAVIPHANYIDWYPNTVSKTEARARLGIAQESKVFLYFGLIRQYKGLPELFAAFERLAVPDSVLLVAGPVRRPDLERLVVAQAERDPRVRAYPTVVPDDEVQLFFNASDAVVLPFRSGLTSGSVVLAMSFARAVVAPDMPCMTAALPAGGAVLYDREQPEALRSALEAALSADLAAMGERNFARALEHDWATVGRLTRQVYESTAS